MATIDYYSEIVLKRLLSQYNNAVNFKGTLKIFADEITRLANELGNITSNIDNLSGKDLDDWGAYLNMPRLSLDLTDFILDVSLLDSLSKLALDTSSANFTLIDDEIYRNVLKTKIIKLYTNSNLNDILLSIMLLTGINDVNKIKISNDTSKASPSINLKIEFSDKLTSNQLLLMNYRFKNEFLWIKPIGFGYNIINGS